MLKFESQIHLVEFRYGVPFFWMLNCWYAENPQLTSKKKCCKKEKALNQLFSTASSRNVIYIKMSSFTSQRIEEIGWKDILTLIIDKKILLFI